MHFVKKGFDQGVGHFWPFKMTIGMLICLVSQVVRQFGLMCKNVHGWPTPCTQFHDLWLYEEQLSRWRKDSPTEKQHTEIERLTDQLTALRHVLTLCLTLTDEMKDRTIDQILAKDDVELAIEFLTGKRKF